MSASPDTEILRPNAAGDEATLAATGEANGWECVDEAITDGFDTYVSSSYSSAYKRDLYNLPASAILGGSTINSVTIYFRCTYTTALAYAKPSLKSNGTVTDGTEVNVSLYTTWTTYSQEWDTNPADEEAWEVADIDALQIGVSLKAPSGKVYCTQVWAAIDYVAAPSITADAATYVAQTTAQLNSTVDDDGGEPCDVRFGYGDETQTADNFLLYDTVTSWVEDIYTTEQHPYFEASG
ncbi:unnamed protein product, partial [marine sediment metagenome]